MKKEIFRGEVLLVDFGKPFSERDSRQAGVRPAIVVSNSSSNKFSPVVIVVPLTTKSKRSVPTHYIFELWNQSFHKLVTNTALCEQVSTISKDQVIKRVGKLEHKDVVEVATKLKVAMGL